MMREMKRRALPVPQLQADELADIVGYLYSLDYFTERGNWRKGEQIINAKGCLNCHSVRGKGGKIGPDFEKMRGLEQPVNVVSAMWNHGAAMEKKVRERASAWPIFKGDEMAHVAAYLERIGSSRQ